MSYGNILVHLEFDGTSGSRLQYATDMAGDLDACLIGFAAGLPHSPSSSLAGAPIHDRARLDELRRHFFEVAGEGRNSEWRQADDRPTAALVASASVADLVLSGTRHGAEATNPDISVDAGSLVVDAGRPVLLVGEGAVFRHPRCAVVGWKPRPQARRALIFALPFLKLAKHTVVLAVPGERDSAAGLDDAVRFLVRHEIDAEPQVLPSGCGPEAFVDAVRAAAADLIVAGACGYGPPGERMLGGFTRALLMQGDLNRLMAG